MIRPLKIGLIGTGSISRLHLLAMKEAAGKVKLTAACDIREDAVRQFAGQAGISEVYTSAESMLKNADIEAVDICVSHEWHRDVAVAAVRAGKHLLLEKPMANSIQECRDILAAAEKAGVTFMVGQQLRHVPSYAAARQLIQDGELGSVWGLRSDSWLPVVMSRTLTPAKNSGQASWRLDGKRAGGGSLIWNATHFIDLFRYFVGDAKRVLARCWSDHPAFTGGAEDRVMATVEFKSGAMAHISNSWSTRTPWQFQFMVLGTEGSIYTPVKGGSALEQHEAPAAVSSPRHDIAGAGTGGVPYRPFVAIEPLRGLFSTNPYANEIVHFADCCRTHREPISSGRDNLGTMKVIFGIYESSRTGQVVDLDTL